MIPYICTKKIWAIICINAILNAIILVGAQFEFALFEWINLCNFSVTDWIFLKYGR
jgi:hypothetical protein